MLRRHVISRLACAILVAELCAPARASDQALMVIANA